MYICDNCDIAGFINVNLKRWASDLNSTKQNIEGALKGLERGLIYSNDGEVIFLKNFLKHQKNLPINENNKAHIGIVKRFNEYKNRFGVESLESLLSLENEGGSKGLQSPIGIGNGKGIGIGNGKLSEKFNFKQSLLDSGADNHLTDDWLKVRKELKATNTETALSRFLNEVKASGHTINEVLKICCEKSWKGFNHTWKVEWDIPARPTHPELDMSDPNPKLVKL